MTRIFQTFCAWFVAACCVAGAAEFRPEFVAVYSAEPPTPVSVKRKNPIYNLPG